MTIKTRIEDTAKKVLDKVNNVNDFTSQRWIWELLQNAKDATTDKGRKTEVKIVVQEDKVEFYHNGNPFDLNSVLGIIL